MFLRLESVTKKKKAVNQDSEWTVEDERLLREILDENKEVLERLAKK